MQLLTFDKFTTNISCLPTSWKASVSMHTFVVSFVDIT
jgi:hypothetical protein